MRKAVLGLAILLGSSRLFAGGYIEGSGGYNNYGIRGGSTWRALDFSFGYFGAYNQSELDSDVKIHVVDAEVYRVFEIPYVAKMGKYKGDDLYGYPLSIKVGGGIGYAMPSVTDGPDKVDNSHAWILGAGADYKLDTNWSIGGSVKALFFNSDTHRETFDVHSETLYIDGNPAGQVEVLEEHHANDSKNFNDVLFGIALKYSF